MGEESKAHRDRQERLSRRGAGPMPRFRRTAAAAVTRA